MTPIIVRVPVWARSTTEIIVVHGLALPTAPETSVNALPYGRAHPQPLPGHLPPPNVSPLPVPVPLNGPVPNGLHLGRMCQVHKSGSRYKAVRHIHLSHAICNFVLKQF